jgi:hypothetical protein
VISRYRAHRVLGTALFVTVVALIAFGLGSIIRHTAGAITSAIGLMFVISIIVQLLPDTWHWDVIRFSPTRPTGCSR